MGKSARTPNYVPPSIPQFSEPPPLATSYNEPAVGGHDECPGCSSGSCSFCCQQITRYWVDADLLIWWRKGMGLPPLVTNNAPNPRVLLGGDDVGGRAEPGVRVNFGYWLDNCQHHGLGASVFVLNEETINFDSRATGESVIVRPFIQNGLPQVLVVNLPPDVTGAVTAQTNSNVFGADVFFRTPIWQDCQTRVDFLTGYQTAKIDEDLTIRHRFTSGGVDFDATDRFATKNEFHGLAFGLTAQYQDPCWTVELLARVAFGNVHQSVIVSGSDTTGVGASASLLARDTNAGLHADNQFAAVRQLGILATYHLNRRVDLTAGYSLIHWKHIVQPGEQIDLNTAPSPPFPRPIVDDSSYFVHGLNFGLRCRY